MKKIFLAGSTGSIGSSALQVVSSYSRRLKVECLAAGHFSEKLKRQVVEINPALCVLPTAAEAEKAKKSLGRSRGVRTEFTFGEAGLKEAVHSAEVDVVLNAISGSSGLMLSYFALSAGKDLALANKESMVTAGEVLNRTAAETGAKIIPVDSEHSALFQCLTCGRKKDVGKLILTASGGPFHNTDKKDFKDITPQMALKHPKWNMGKKISIDSATLANKGLEVIEAHYLFGIDESRIDVLIHPQAVVHSMVEYMDGAIIAQMGPQDMKGPIAYALSYPGRLHGLMKSIDLAEAVKLEFFKPDTEKFPFLRLARHALKEGKSMPAVFCEANEYFVNLFLAGKINFTDIASHVEEVMLKHKNFPISAIEDALDAKKDALRLSGSLV